MTDNEGLTDKNLAAVRDVRHQSTRTVVATLADLRLIERRRDPGTGRRLLSALTAEGRRSAYAASQARSVWLATELERKCTEEERQTVIAAMAILERLVHD
ncbi:hypothetical protein [Streptomyces sp. NPDC002520]